MNFSFKKNFVLVAASLAVTSFLLAVGFNALIEKDIQRDEARRLAALKGDPSTVPSEPPAVKKKFELVPNDPAKYGIIEHGPQEIPRTAAQWDLYMQEALQNGKVFEQPGGKEAIELMRKPPSEIETRKKEIDDRIALFEKRKQENPSDLEAEDHLQGLLMLKSLLHVLEDKFNTVPDDPSLPAGYPQQK